MLVTGAGRGTGSGSGKTGSFIITFKGFLKL